MKKVNLKNNLSITYISLTDDGKNLTKTNVINNLNDDLTDDDLHEIATLLKNLMKYNSEKVLRKSEYMLEEDS